MNALQLLTGPAAQAIGWALLHLLWQATIVAGILAAVLSLMQRQSASARYVLSCGALAMVFALFVATAVRAYDPAAEPVPASAASSPETIRISLSRIPILIAETAAVSLRDRVVAAASSARTALPSIVAVWLAGVVLLSARLLVSWLRARGLVRHAAQPVTAEWQRVASRLADALGLRRAVTLLESAAIEVPSVIGTMRPIILLPASALTGLTPQQIEMVLAHELAHIRRHDFFVNLLQAVVETLMFYHPAVWWMSRRVRIERENCCDDLAVAVCGNPIQYARALTRLEEIRSSALQVLVAANGGSLLDRIRRIATGRAEGTTSTSRWAAAVAMLSILVIAVAIPSIPALAQRDDEKRTATPRVAAATVEVTEDADDADDADANDGDHTVDVDVDVDAVGAPDLDVDLDLDLDVPEPPMPPHAPSAPNVAPAPPAPAPAPVISIPALPAVAPTPHPMPHPVPVPPRAPRAPRPPQIAHGAIDVDFDDDDDHDDDHERGGDGSNDTPITGDRKLTVDELISLRASGVTPEFLDSMRAIFPRLTIRDVSGLAALSVTPEYVRQMRAAGFEVQSPREATSLKAVGVTPEYVQQMRNAGFEIKSARDITGLRAMNVTPDFVREMRNAGFGTLSARDATSLRAMDVTLEYVRQMRDAGFAIQSAKDVVSLRAVGVTPQWVRDMRAAGVDVRSARDASSLRALDVTPEFVRKLAAAGYTNLSVREIKRLAAAGVDDDFIREMEQYRKKN